MDPNFLVNLFNSNKIDDSKDQNKTFNPNSQSLMASQTPNFQPQLPLMFNLNQAFASVPPQNPNINKEMSQSLLSILQKKEPEKNDSSSNVSPLPTNEERVQTPVNQTANLSNNTEELKKLLQINTTIDNNSNSISIASAPPIQDEKKVSMEPSKTSEKPKVQSNPNTPLFGYINPFTAINSNNKEKFTTKTEKSDSEYEVGEAQDTSNDGINQQKKETENIKPKEIESCNFKPLKEDIIFNLDSSLDNAKPAKEIITVAKIKRNIEKVSGKEIAVNNKYICYSSSKNKNIRIIHQESGDLRLFKGHEQRIIDTVVFVSKNQNKSSLKAASIDIDNTLILWTEDNNKELKKLLVVKE